VAYGGDSRYPSMAIGTLLGNPASTNAAWDLITGVEGRNGPRCPEGKNEWSACGFWGDYLTVRPFRTAPNDAPSSWATVGFTASDPFTVGSHEGQKIALSYINFLRRDKIARSLP
jgi:hypothetical protein